MDEVEGRIAMEVSDVISRRHFMAAAAGTLTAAAVAGSAKADAAPHTLWVLNPSWGSPRTTSTGATKTECSSAACHSAAPHRLFLTRADAIAGRLHAGCMAEPEEVKSAIDLNALMPYYNARKGGIDGRCPALTAPLRTAVYAAIAGVESRAMPTELPRTGSDASSLLSVAAATTAIGVYAWAATSRDAPAKR